MSTLAPSSVYSSNGVTVSAPPNRIQFSKAGYSPAVFLSFLLPPADRHRYLKNVVLHFRHESDLEDSFAQFMAGPLDAPFNESALFSNGTLPPVDIWPETGVVFYSGGTLSSQSPDSNDHEVALDQQSVHRGAAFAVKALQPGDLAAVPVNSFYISYTAVAAKLQANNLFPSSGFRNRKSAMQLTWGYGAEAEGNPVPYTSGWELAPASAEIEWKSGAAGTVYALSSADGKTCTVPANTFPATDELMWRVRITSNDGVVGGWSTWAVFSAENPSLHPVFESPASGYLNRNKDNIFAWGLAYNRPGYTGLTQTAATVEWRVGSSGAVHSVSTGTAQSTTFAANTFPASSEIQWRVTVTDSGGTTTAGSWKILNTTESTPVVTAISPSTAYVAGDQPTRFTWLTDYAVGGTQKTFEIEALANGSSVTVKTGTQPETYTDILPSELPSGQIKWRVKVTNADDVESAWSNYLDVVVVTPPAAPSITVTRQSPLPSVSWESVEQQAYEVRINGDSSGVFFGAGKTFQAPLPLPDGIATIAVRVQNSFGLWSDWAEASLTIINVPGTAFPVGVSGVYDAALTWDPVDGAVIYVVYRDGTALKKTADTAFTDPGSAGSVRYTVKAIMADGTYTESQPAPAQIAPPCPILSSGDGNWLELRYTADSAPTIKVTAARDVTVSAFSDHVYPIAERSNRRTKTISLAVACLRSDADTNARLDAMLGETIYFKDQYGNSVVGVFASYSSALGVFIRTYTLSVEVTDA